MSTALFAADPARDARFSVRERWIDCENFPGDHPLHKVQFFHRQMNEEVDSLEASAQTLVDFTDAAWELRLALARQCADEARHAVAYRAQVERRGGHVGQFPVMNFQYRIITARTDVISRLVIQNRSFEAGGLDAIAYGVEESHRTGDHELAEFYAAQLADEISHVRFANQWIRKALKEDPRTLLRIGVSLNAAAAAFRLVMGAEGTEGVDYPAAVQARLDAGFTPEEVKTAAELAAAARGASAQVAAVT
jgi:alkylhydroperoxidase/carboxymuconolactone decarboxylase family protein YurZ